MTVRYTPEAVKDLREIKTYIHKVLKNPKAADRIAKSILDSCSHLKSHAELGMALEARIGLPGDLRYLICEKYIAFYRIDESAISIARILDGRQDYLHILFQDDWNRN